MTSKGPDEDFGLVDTGKTLKTYTGKTDPLEPREVVPWLAV